MRDIKGCIKKHEGSFSKTEKRIAEYFIEKQDKVLEQTVEDIAQATNTSGATVVRFCRTIGFRGFMDFKFQMEGNALYVIEEEQRISQKDDINSIKNKVIQYAVKMLGEFNAAMDDADLAAAADLLAKAKRIFIFAEGGSASMAEYAKSSMIHTGICCIVETDASMQVMSAEYLDPTDVAIGISHSGRIRSTVDALSIAKRRGIPTIAITGTHGTPICEQADVVLACDISHQFDLSDFQGSRMEEFCTLSVLQMAVLMKMHDSAAEIAQRVSTSVEGYRRIKRE